MKHLHIDFETRSTIDLRAVGVDVYAVHPTTAIWCMAYAFDDENVQVRPGGRESVPDRVIEHVRNGGPVYAHNVAFEFAMWNAKLAGKSAADNGKTIPPLRIEQCFCTMAMAYAMSLPGDLEQAAMAAGLDVRKDMEGRRLMLQMARPRRVEPDGTIVWWDDAERRRKLFAYCVQDVIVERALSHRLLPLNENERKVWLLDHKINRRGVNVDIESCEKVIAAIEAEKRKLDDEMFDVTDGDVGACTQVGDLRNWLVSMGVPCDSVAKDAVTKMLDEYTEGPVHRALSLRQEAGRSSTAKFAKMVECVGPNDTRLRGMFQYHGAGTGRWAARKVQLHNLPRPDLPQELIEAAFELLDNLELMELVVAPLMRAAPNMLRGVLCAAPGHDLLAADYTAIESRVLAWLSGAERKLNVFRAGQCIYCHVATGIYGRTITKQENPDERQVGKVGELSLGFGGGVGAFQSMAKNYNVFVPDEEADIIKSAWRADNPETVQYWWDLEDAAKNAIRKEGGIFVAGPIGRQVKYRMKGSFLWCQLPSRRVLCYPYPRLEMRMKWWGDEKETIVFKGVDSETKRWVDQETYGGSLSENVTQAVARDLLAEGALRAEENGYPLVLHVHDELVSEVREGQGDLHEFETLMSQLPAWAAGLPVAAEGWRGKRYRK